MAKSANPDKINPFAGKVKAKRKQIIKLENMKKKDITNPVQHIQQLDRARKKHDEFIIKRDAYNRGEIDKDGHTI